MEVKADVKSLFFDRAIVIEALGKAKAKWLGRAAGAVRLTAQRSIKKKGLARKAPKNASGKAYARWREEIAKTPASPPGSPPFTHTGFLRKDIVYSLDPGSRSAVIGPHTTPWLNALHEYGGERTMYAFKSAASNRTFLANKPTLGRSLKATRSVKAKYPQRSFMGRAIRLPETQAKLTALWSGAIKT